MYYPCESRLVNDAWDYKRNYGTATKAGADEETFNRLNSGLWSIEKW
jgi:hypothetical protein